MFRYKTASAVGIVAAITSTAVSSSRVKNESKKRRSFYAENEESTLVLPIIVDNDGPTKTVKNVPSPVVNEDTITTSEYLEKKFHHLRKWTISHFDHYYYEYQTAKSSAYNELDIVNKKYHEIVVDPVLPNLIYVLTSTFTGSVLANRRGLMLRFVSPLTFGIAAFGYFMPQSFENTRRVCWNLEKKWTPSLAAKHLECLIGLEKGKVWVNEEVDKLDKNLVEMVSDVRKRVFK